MHTELTPKAAEIAGYARSLLTSGGYNSFSYADISDRVRISKASIHHHFPSKAELVQTIVRLHRDAAQKGLAALSQQLADPLAELRAYADRWSACILDGSTPFCICGMLAAELPTIPENVAGEVQGFFRDLTDWLTSVLKRGAAEGQFALQGTAAQEAKTFMAIVYGAMLTARASGDPKTFRSIVQPAIARLTSATESSK
jgi:TetR/AcrR family transcriptional regulator, transcriptional repressor for nem operon